jgi:hypothetical protein
MHPLVGSQYTYDRASRITSINSYVDIDWGWGPTEDSGDNLPDGVENTGWGSSSGSERFEDSSGMKKRPEEKAGRKGDILLFRDIGC